MTIDEIVRLEDLLIKKPSLLDCSPCCQNPIIQRQSLFNSLRSKHNNRSDKIKHHSSPTKVCVRPIVPRKKEDNLAQNKASKFPVYFYYEERKRAFCHERDETGFQLPEYLVTETMDWLKKNKDGEISKEHKKDSSSEYDENDGCQDSKSLEKVRDEINQILKTMKSADEDQADGGDECE